MDLCTFCCLNISGRRSQDKANHIRWCLLNPKRKKYADISRKTVKTTKTVKAIKKMQQSKILWHKDHPGVFSGVNNPNYKGGDVDIDLGGWNRQRKKVWARDKTCQLCHKKPKKNRRLDVHHLIRRRHGGSDDLENLIGLHHSCHMKVESGKAKIGRMAER